ncbi:hypothetical protein CPB84DRAFT_1783604 [Gymnopilus junonius]|uniref:DUF6534 domain-containing protein n=1 Tax=Gymnopilus junonius TaxID=109634 RepID=A0A9P5NL97_GYMJU|nr:hypothetical protein CPB84DRAFT_1783604 [Gymnopilus junonius]
MYHLAVTNFGNPSALSTLTLSIDIAIFFSAIITTVVQSFFIERLRILSKNRWIGMACWALSLGRLSLLMVMFERMVEMRHMNAADVVKAVKPLFTPVLIGGSILDFFIAFYLCYYIKLSKPKAHFWSTTVMLDTVATWSIETRLLTGVTELIFLISVRWAWEAVFFFSNTLLAALNGRRRLQNTSHLEDAGRVTSRAQPHAIAIQINKTTEVTRDPVFQYGVF